MKRLLSWLTLVTAALPLPTAGIRAGPPPPPLRVTFLSLDYGDATLVQAPGGMVGLLGAGAARDGDAVIRYLRRHGIRKVDVLVAAAWSERYLGGVPALLRSVHVSRVLRNPLYVPTAAGERALKEVQQHGIEAFSPTPGDFDTLYHTPPC